MRWSLTVSTRNGHKKEHAMQAGTLILVRHVTSRERWMVAIILPNGDADVVLGAGTNCFDTRKEASDAADAYARTSGNVAPRDDVRVDVDGIE